MHSKNIYENKKKEILDILDDESIDSSEKIKRLNFFELLENLEIYQAELRAQNYELIEKEQSLVESRDEFETLFNLSPIGHLKLDKQLHILRYNKKAKELLSLSATTVKIKKQLGLFVDKEDIISHLNLFDEAKIHNHAKGRLRLKRQDNTPLHTHITINKIFKDEDEFYLVSIEDITKQIEQEVALLAQTKSIAMGEMLSMITHQWKQPLSVLSTVGSTMDIELENDMFEQEKFQNYTEVILGQIEYMNNTVDDFKNFFKAQSEKKAIDTKVCVENAIRFTKPSLASHSIEFDIEYIESPDLTINAYPNDVCQVLMNIINNAKDELKHSQKKRKIELKIYNQSNNVVFALKNNGGTISHDIQDKLFDKNFSTKASDDGSGLGLYISKKIVEEHLNGTLRFKNIQDQQSVVFYLEIPLYKPEKRE